MNTPTPARPDADERLEVAPELAVSLGQLVERSNQTTDRETQARLQEPIEWTRYRSGGSARRVWRGRPAMGMMSRGSQQAFLLDVIEAGIRVVLAQAEAGAIGDGSISKAHERLSVEWVGVDSVEVLIDDHWPWKIHVSRPRYGYRQQPREDGNR